LIPLNAHARQLFAKQTEQVEVHRVDTLRLVLAPQQEELLRNAAEATARFIEAECRRRRQLFFEQGAIDDTWMVAWDMRKTVYFEIYEVLGSKNFREACEAVSERWKSFKELLKLKERLKLELHVNPPSAKRRRMVVFVGHENYRIDAQRKVLRLGYWNIEIPFKGELRWLPQGKQGRLIIVYDPMKGKWYARVSVEVPLQPSTAPGLKAGIDLGREILATVAVENGTALLYRGGPLKSDYYYFERKIAEVNRALSELEEVDRDALRERRRWLYDKMRRRREQVFAKTAAHIAKALKALNVSVVFIGYPRNIAHDKAGKGNTNMWSYWKLITRMAVTLENCGIAAFAVPEDGTSQLCARHGCRVERVQRGLVKCPHGHVAHADVNAATNILKRGASALGCEVELPERIEVLSFTPTPERVIERKRKAHNPAV